MSFDNLSLSASSDSSTGSACAGSAAEPEAVLFVLVAAEVADAAELESFDPENWFNAAINSFGSAPDNSFKIVCFLIKMKYGTALTSNNSLISDKSSAFIERNTIELSSALESAKVLNTWFMVLQGPAQGVWKYKARSFESDDWVISVNCSSLSISITPISSLSFFLSLYMYVYMYVFICIYRARLV